MNTSILLGAGFSRNKGYPTAYDINKKLSSLDIEDFYRHSNGSIYFKPREAKSNYYNSECIFLIKLIKYYIENISSEFNYENFYDFCEDGVANPNDNLDINDICEQLRESTLTPINNLNYFDQAKNILNQIITLLLIDSDGKQFYDDVSLTTRLYPGYSGFFNCLEAWGQASTVHIHTLNHDIFFESFKNSIWLGGQLADGFQELGSSYYGKLKNTYMVRLRYFTNKYDEKFNLYKLHGSIDQLPFHIEGNGIDNFVKVFPKYQITELYKEVEEPGGKLKYVNDWINFYPDFLSGTTSKILRYSEPLYYDKVVCHFKQNLANAEKLVIVGYGAADSEINKIIKNKFDFNSKPVYIVDPYPSSLVKDLSIQLGGKLICKTPDNLSLADF